MIVRDRTKPKSDWAAQGVNARDEMCPCRPCFQPHDVGRRDHNGKHTPKLVCITRDNYGCPDALTESHQIKPRGTRCACCGTSKKRIEQLKSEATDAP